MANMMPTLAAMAPMLGGLLTGKANLDAGKAIRKENYYEAAQVDRNAEQAIAASHVNAQDNIRKYEYLASKALAMYGNAGGGVMDPDVLKNIAGIRAEGELQTQRDLYQGKEQARGMRAQAAGLRFSGDNAKRGSRTKAIASVLAGGNQGAINWFGAERFIRMPENP